MIFKVTAANVSILEKTSSTSSDSNRDKYKFKLHREISTKGRARIPLHPVLGWNLLETLDRARSYLA